MLPSQLLIFLQLHDSLFPTGAFAYSDGLETAVLQEIVKQEADLAAWLDHYLSSVFALSEGRALCQAMPAYHAKDWEALAVLDHELTALKPAAATRASSVSIGKRLLKTALPLYPAPGLKLLLQKIETRQLAGNHPVTYGALLAELNFSPQEALLGFGYSRLAGLISAAMRLMAFGQAQGQLLLNQQWPKLAALSTEIIHNSTEPLQSLGPLLDSYQMNHRFVYSRLFRS